MIGVTTWSHRPYRPLLTEVGDIYICRLAPSTDAVCVEWLPIETDTEYEVLCRRRGDDAFTLCGKTRDTAFTIDRLQSNTDYELYVACGERKSRVRLARCGESIGTVVNYLHPEDKAYIFSGNYLCSPSLVRHPDGYLLASMDVFAANHPQNLTLIFRSDDDGQHWHYVSELTPCFWGKMFIHRGELYMLACSTEYGDLLIGKSSDGGKTFSAPVTLLRGSNGKAGQVGVHKNPQNVVHYGGRIWETLEWGAWANRDYGHAAMVMSCDENADLLDPASWHFTPPSPFAHFVDELADLPLNTMTIEGTLVVDPDGKLLNVMRFGKLNTALVYEVNGNDPDAPLTFSRLMPFSANYSKFMIKRDARTGDYYTIGTRVYDPAKTNARDLLSLMRSHDLKTFEVVTDLYDFRACEDTTHIGLQYVDFEIEGDDIIYLCRTALNGAANFHDTNYSTFHRIKQFRTLGNA